MSQTIRRDGDGEGFDRGENQLLERLRSGDGRAFETLVRENGGRMLAVARRFLANEEDAADAVQEAFVAAFQHLDSFHGTSRLSTWLHRIVVNACLMKARSKARRPERSLEDLLPSFDGTGHHAEPPCPWATSPLSDVTKEETRRQVRESIDQLPDDYRAVLILRDIEELDTEQTAEILGISQPAVKTRLHRARLALKTLLDPVFAT
jgi:RNA polymerase sigma-70 factor (ECF subfamily)